MKQFFLQSILGLFFGAFVMVVLTSVMVLTGRETIDGGSFIKDAIGYILCGWLFAVTPLFFEIQSLRLSQQTALHFFTAICPYLILAAAIGWVPVNVQSILLSALLFLLIYAVIWTSFYLYFRKEANNINEKLNQL